MRSKTPTVKQIHIFTFSVHRDWMQIYTMKTLHTGKVYTGAATDESRPAITTDNRRLPANPDFTFKAVEK